MIKLFRRKRQTESIADIQKDLDEITKKIMADSRKTIENYYKERK